jgi:hypothetical protein
MAVDQHESELRTVPQDGAEGADSWAAHGGRPPLARLLTEAGLVTDAQIQAAVEEGARTGERFGEVLLRRGAVTEEDLAHLLADQWSLPFVENPGAAVDDLPADRAREIPAAALASDGGSPLVALADPTEERFEHVRSLLGRDVSFVVVTQATLDRLLGEVAGDVSVQPIGLTEIGVPSALAEARRSLGTIGEAFELLEAAVDFAERQAAELATTRASLADAERRLSAAAAELESERTRIADLEAQRTRIPDLEAQIAERDELLTSVRAALGELQGVLGAS